MTFRCLISFLLSFTTSVVCAQLSGKLELRGNLTDFPYTISVFGTKNNIPQSQIDDIIQDSGTGDLLFATAEGVVHFNGYVFTTIRNQTKTRNQIFSRLFYSPISRETFGLINRSGLYQVGTRIEYFTSAYAADLVGNELITIDSLGVIQVRNMSNGKNRKIVSAIIDPSYIIGRNGRFVISNDRETFMYDERANKSSLVGEGIIKSHFIGVDGKLYLILKNQVWQLDGDLNEHRVLLNIKDPQLDFTDAINTDQGMLITSNKGLYILQNGQWKQYATSDLLPTNKLNCIYREPYSNCLFIGTGDKGLIRLEIKTAKTWYSQDLRLNGGYTSILAISADRILTGSNRAVIRLGSDMRSVIEAEAPANLSSLALVDGKILAGTWGGGLRAFDLQTMREVASYFKGRIIIAVFRDSRKRYWVATDRCVYTGMHLDSLVPFETGRINKQVICFYETRDHRLLIGGVQGVYVIDAQNRIADVWNESRGYDAKEVRSFLEDDAGRIWVGTYGGGLYCYQKGVLKSLSKQKNYLLGSDVFTLARTFQNDVLISSNNGLKRVKLSQLIDFLEGRSDYLIPYLIDENNGVYNTEFNGGFQNNYATVDRKTFYFPTIQGCLEYNSAAPLSDHGKVRILGLRANSILQENLSKPLSRKTEEVKIEFASANFSESINSYYQYKIASAGQAGVWSPLQKGTDVTFSQLPPGTYVFTVRVLDALHHENPSEATIRFTIAPYFFETWLFRISALILLIAIIVFVLERRAKKRQQKAAEKADLERQLQEVRIQALHAQMNPHFLFNSMNLVNHLISIGKNEEAQQVVIDFSRLLRKILAINSQKFNTIQEEVEIIRYYLGIQHFRFQDRLQYDIEVADGLDAVLIPSWILQPLVENAIVHGVAHLKQGTGVIRIVIEDLGRQVKITLTDNGVGRKESARINAGREQHRSLGSTLVYNKIHLLREEFQLSIDLQYEDIEDGNERGTIVTLKFDKYDPLSDRGR
jgi:two-component sensor histidine kinase